MSDVTGRLQGILDLSDPNAEIVRQFELISGHQYQFSLTGANWSALDFRLETTSGEVVQSNTGNGLNERIDYTPKSSGVYNLVIHSAYDYGTSLSGNYTLDWSQTYSNYYNLSEAYGYMSVELDDGNYMVFFHNGAEPDGLSINYPNDPDTSSDVYYQIVDSSGNSIGNPHVVNETTYHTQYNPKVLELADGTFVVAWSQSQNGSSFAVGYQQFNADGRRIGNEVLLQTQDDPIDTLDLTSDGAGGFRIFVGRTSENFDVSWFDLLQSSGFNLDYKDVLTVVPGQDFLFKIENDVYEEQLTYSGPQIWWGDLDWLAVDTDGVISGLVPQDFQNGGARIFYDREIDAHSQLGSQSGAFEVVDFLTAWNSAGWDEPVMVLQPNTWSDQLKPVYFNSTAHDILFGDVLIQQQTVQPGGANVFSKDYFDSFREGLGIYANGSQFDDFYNLTGYSINEFDVTHYAAKLSLTVGHDVFIAPDFTKSDGRFVGELSARRYFDANLYGGDYKLDASEGLIFEFLGLGNVLVHDAVNESQTTAYNISNVQTSMLSNDTVVGDDDASWMSSQGGVDTFIGKGGQDYFKIRYRDNDEITDRQINIFEYEAGETIQIADFGFTENYLSEYEIGFDPSHNKTVIKLNTGMFQGHQIVTIDGQWRVTGEATIGQGVYDTDNSDNWLKFSFTEAWNEAQDGLLVVDGYAREYGFELQPVFEDVIPHNNQSTVGFQVDGADLIWRSPNDPTISLLLNDTKSESWTGELKDFNTYQTAELHNGNIAVAWYTTLRVEAAPGYFQEVNDLYVRVLDPKAGQFVTDEVVMATHSGVFGTPNWYSAALVGEGLQASGPDGFIVNVRNNQNPNTGEYNDYSVSFNPDYLVKILDKDGYEKPLVDVERVQFDDQNINVQDIYDSLIATGEYEPPTLNQPTILGSGDDTFYGDIEDDYVETGGGDDRIMSEGGDDHIVVQGAGEVIVDAGSGRDIVEVDPAFVGGLTITNGQETEVEASSLTIVIDKPAWRLMPNSDTATNKDYKITLDGGENEILIKDYFFTDEEGYVTTNDISIRHIGWEDWGGWDAGYTGMVWESVRGSNQDNQLYSSVYDRDKTDDYVPVVEDGIVYSMSGWAGDDVFHIGGGLNQIFGGRGDDAFHIDLVAQNTSIVGDIEGESGNPSLKEDGLPDYDTVNTDYGDAAYFSFEWPTLIDNPDFNPKAVEDANNPRYLKDPDSYIEQLGKGHFKVHHKLENGEEINVEMYDVEGAYFSDGEGGLEYHALTTGRPITSDDFGNLRYETNDVKFWVEHNDADYGGATTIAVVTTVTKTVTDPVTKQRISYEEPTVKWKGLATEADSFVFSDVTINVINVAQTDLTGVPIEDTTVYGTAGIDLIIGDEFDNLIFGGDDNDIIFGGAGDDEIYGEGGDDVLIGDVGEDILYGDYHEDALKPAEELDTRGKVMNASELDGDDIIVGGAGVDKIDSGEGQNVAASGDLSSVILNAELDEMHTFLDYDEDDLPV